MTHWGPHIVRPSRPHKLVLFVTILVGRVVRSSGMYFEQLLCRSLSADFHSFFIFFSEMIALSEPLDCFLFFFIHSVTKSALQCAANTSSSFAFFADGPCWRDSTFLMYSIDICGIFSRWRFNPWAVCFPGLLLPSESYFPQSMHCALLVSVWPNKYPPLLNTLSTEADVHGAQKVLSNNGFRMANCFCCRFTKCHGVPCSLPSSITTKVLKNCKTFSSRPRPRPIPNVQDQDEDFMIQDQDFHFCPRGASRPKPWSRGLRPTSRFFWRWNKVSHFNQWINHNF